MASPRPRDAALLAALTRRLGSADPVTLTNLAWFAARRGEHAAAQEVARRAIAQPGAPRAAIHALECLAAGRSDELLLVGAGAPPRTAPAESKPLAAAVSAHRHADLAMAETCYRAALAHDALAVAATNGLAVLHYQRHEFAAADEAWQHAITAGDLPAVHNRALGWLRAGEVHRARRVLQPWIADGRADAALHFLDGYLALAESVPEEALTSLQAALHLDPDMARAHFTLGLAHERLGQHAEALGATRKALLLSPWYVPHLWLLVSVPGAPAVELAAEHAAGGRHATDDVLLSLGRSLLETGHLGEALAVFDQVLVHQPQQPAALFHRGVVLAKLRRYEEALEDWEAVDRADPAGPLGAVSRRHASSARQLASLFPGGR